MCIFALSVSYRLVILPLIVSHSATSQLEDLIIIDITYKHDGVSFHETLTVISWCLLLANASGDAAFHMHDGCTMVGTASFCPTLGMKGFT